MMLLHCLSQPAASIWFEIWEVADPGLKKSNFPGKFMKNFDFFSCNFIKYSIFPGKFPKNFDSFGQCHKKFDFPGKIGHLQQLLKKLFYFSSKVTTFEHTSCI